MIDNLHKTHRRGMKELSSGGMNGIPPKLLEISGDLKNNLKISSSRSLDSSLQVISDILSDESKNRPWKHHVYNLGHYVDWLYAHSINVAIISLMIAEKLNLWRQLSDIALGAILHDIGKLTIPKHIVQKPGKLTDEELFYMRHHCEHGIIMVKDCKLSQTSIDIIGQHHERLDGSGYPLGRTGGQIPLHTRIVLIADVIDSMTSYRPYKRPKQIEDSIKELRDDPAKYPQDILETLRSMLL